MLGSTNSFFLKDKESLDKHYLDLLYLLDVWEIPPATKKLYITAYLYFVEHPTSYDGATIVNDITLIPDLDIWAMVHDYLYITYNVAVDFRAKLTTDLLYIKLMRTFKVSWGASWLVRFGGLLLTTLPFMFREYFITKKRYSIKNRVEFEQLIFNLK
jgi:hypothetical protein